MAKHNASPLTNNEFKAMLNDVVLKLWNPAQKEKMLSKEEIRQLIETCDELIDKYKTYTYTFVAKGNDGEEVQINERPYIEDFALATLEIICANEAQKKDQQDEILKYLEGY